MANIPQPWRAYACLQSKLSGSVAIDYRSWGVEAGLNLLLKADPALNAPDEAELARARSTAARRERSRARWRALRLTPTVQTSVEPDPGLEARGDLQILRERTTRDEWELLCGVAAGHEYADLASSRAATVGALRVTVTRLRARLRTSLVGSAPNRGHFTPTLVQ